MQQGHVTFRGLDPGQCRETLEYLTVPEIADAKRLLQLWQARPADGWVMGRDVPSRMLATLLSHIAVWEPVEQATDFRARLGGDALHRRFDDDIKGWLMSELFPAESLHDHIAAARRVLDHGTPEIFRSLMIGNVVDRLCAEVVFLPVSSPDRTSTWILAGAFFL